MLSPRPCTEICLGTLRSPFDRSTKRKRSKDPETKERKVVQDAENRASFFRSFKEANSIYSAETRIELCELGDRLIERKIL